MSTDGAYWCTRRHLLAWVLGLGAGVPVCAQQSGPTPYPTRPADWPGEGAIRVFDYMSQNRTYFWARRAMDQRALVFVGDSLTGGWTGLAKDFPQVKVANRGIGGDVTRGMLFRFGEDVLDLNPAGVVMLAGSADLSALQAPALALRNIAAMADLLKKRSPATPLILCTVPPRMNPAAPVDPARIAELNDGIKNLALARDGITVVDLHAVLTDAEGKPVPAYFASDLLHLSPAGYRAWKAELEPRLRRMGLLN